MWDELIRSAGYIEVDRGARVLRAGEVCRHGYFVVRGCLMHQYLGESGDVHVLGFFDDSNYRYISSPSYFTQDESDYEIVALEDSRLLAFSRDVMERLSLESSEFGAFYRGIMSQALVTFYRYTTMRLSLSPAAFIERLHRDFPFIPGRVPDKYIAAFLGISREWYSKVKRKA